VNLIHHYCDIGVWTRMAIRFSERVAFVDDRTDKFLTTLARLGGYCTVEQAQAMGLASSASQVQALLNGLERGGFLRRVAEYPLVYQVTKSVVRLIGTDLWARRQRAIETVRWRLAVVGFYLEARQWPPISSSARREDRGAGEGRMLAPIAAASRWPTLPCRGARDGRSRRRSFRCYR